MNKCEVYFGLVGQNFDPAEISKAIPVEAEVRRFEPPRFSSWKCTTGTVEGEVIDVNEMSTFIVSKLSAHTDSILNVKSKFNLKAVLEVVLTISLDDSKSTPAIGFEEEVIAFLNDVGATIDIDTYRGD